MLREGWHQPRVAWQRLLLEVGALQTLVGSGALSRVVHEEEVEQTKAGVGEPREALLEVVVGLMFEGEVLQGGQLGVAGPDVVVRGAEESDDELQLVDLRAARQERLVAEQFTQDAASSPHVDSRGLRLGHEEQLRRTVPECHHLGRHGLRWRTVQPSQAKVSDLHTAFVCEKAGLTP